MSNCPKCGRKSNYYWHPYCSLACMRIDRQSEEMSHQEYLKKLNSVLNKTAEGKREYYEENRDS